MPIDDPAPIKLFEAKEKIYPTKVSGKYRNLRSFAMVILLGIYYLVPWIRYDRGPGVPDQAILIDMIHGRAYFFAIEIWPQEVYYITAILIIAAVALFFITSLLGRVWCGYACPQTIWTDLFIIVERFFQGERVQRMRLDKSPYNFNKIWRKSLTHLSWILIGLFTGGAWVFYFNDAPTLVNQLVHFEAPLSSLFWIVALTFSTYLMAGFAREQVCIYMCPYSRFQSAMFDKNSLIISYDESRGEPRGKHKQGDDWKNKGHCIDCKKCVTVCPQGIDIREGLQMECIACGFCIDACNSIMKKLSLPMGLIRYDTSRNKQLRLESKPEVSGILRARTLYYSLILIAVISVTTYSLITRKDFDLHILHSRNPLFVTLSDSSIRNSYEIKIMNKSHIDKYYKLDISGLDDYRVSIRGHENNPKSLFAASDNISSYYLFLTSPKQAVSNKNITFELTDVLTEENMSYETIFISSKKEHE